MSSLRWHKSLNLAEEDLHDADMQAGFCQSEEYSLTLKSWPTWSVLPAKHWVWSSEQTGGWEWNAWDRNRNWTSGIMQIVWRRQERRLIFLGVQESMEVWSNHRWYRNPGLGSIKVVPRSGLGPLIKVGSVPSWGQVLSSSGNLLTPP